MSTDPALVTGRLNVNDYVQARKVDIKRLEGLITGSGAHQKKRAFQSLPRVERRRAASHDPKRVPRKRGLRTQAEFENLRDNAKKRKLRSRPVSKKAHPHGAVDFSSVDTKADHNELHKACVLRYSNRQRDKVWLPTHIWHKKRAFLTNLSGFMVPLSATQKQYRRTYRLTSYIDERGAMAWDTSYYATIVARGSNTKQHLEDLFPGSTATVYLAGSKFWQGFAPKIGPLLIHWLGSTVAALHCHPVIFDDIWDSLEGSVELEDCRYAIGSIDIAGPNTLNLLGMMLSGAQLTTDDVFEDWNKLRSLGTLPYRGALNFLTEDPRLASSRGSGVILTQSGKSFGEKVVYFKQCRIESLEKQLSQSEVDKLNTVDPSERPAGTSGAQIPITLLALENGRIRILLPWNWVLPFWLTLFRRRHTAIGGQQELQQFAFDSKLPFFPRDFPETRAGADYNAQVASEAEATYSRKPKSKRDDYTNEIANPFMLADLKKLDCDALCHISLTSLGRGVPKAGARIFGLQNSEIARKVTEKDRIIDTNLMAPSNLIGFVTSGNYSLSSSKGAGIGLIKDASLTSTIIVRNPGCAVGFLASASVVPKIRNFL